RRSGHVVLGALPSCGLTLVPIALSHLHEAYPGLTTRLVEAPNDELMRMVGTNQIEFAVATLPEATEVLVSLPLIEDWLCAVFPPGQPLDAKDRPPRLDVHRFDQMLLALASSAREQFERPVPNQRMNAATLLLYIVTQVGTAARLVRKA